MSRPLPLALLAPLLLATACVPEAASPADDAGEDWNGVQLSSLSWALTWDRSGVEPLADGGWNTTNDLGVQFHVERGWLSSYSASLAPCVTVGDSEQEWARLGLLERLLGIGLARADHSTEPDPSALDEPVLEDLVALDDVVLEELSFETQSYCRAHYLVARADADTPDPATDTTMALVTLRLEGHWSHGDETGPLEVESAFNYGALFELNPESTEGVGPQATVTLERRAARLFDSVEPGAQSTEVLSWQITENLVSDTRVYFGQGLPD